MGSQERGRLLPGPGCSGRGRPPWSARPGSQPQMQKQAVRLHGGAGGQMGWCPQLLVPSATPLSCFAPAGASTHARPGRGSVCACDASPAARWGSGSPRWWPGPSPHLCHPCPSAEACLLWGHRQQMGQEARGRPGPRPGRAEPPSLCPDPHAGEPPALHGVKTERFSSAPADCLSSGLISKTSLFAEEKLPFPPGCVSLPLITSRVSVPGPLGMPTRR